MIEYITAALVAVGGLIASKPFLMRMAIQYAFKFAMVKSLNWLKNYRKLFPQDSQEWADCKEVLEAVLVLQRLLGQKLGLYVPIKQLETRRFPKDRKAKRIELKQVRNQKTRRIRQMKRNKRGGPRIGGKTFIMILVAASILFCGSAIAEDEPVSVWTWQFKTTFAVWYNIDDFEPDSLALVNLGQWTGLFDLPINVAVGLKNFEQVEVSGEQWWDDLEPVVGISMDTKPLLELLPVLGSWIEKIPDAVSFGAGITAKLESLDDLDDLDFGLWVGITL